MMVSTVAGRARIALALIGAALLVLVAMSCGSSHASPGYQADASDHDAGEGADASLPGLVSLTVSPSSAPITSGDTPSSQPFTASGTFADGSSRNVTSAVAWTIAPASLL